MRIEEESLRTKETKLCPYINSGIQEIANEIREQIDAFRPYVNLIQALRNPGMHARHFIELSDRIGIQISMTPTLTLKNCIVLGIMEFEEIVIKISEGAAKEHSIEESLDKMYSEWQNITMEFIPHKTSGE